MLTGIRVLDLTWVWSGPLAGRILADLGAEVIHIVGRTTVSGSKISQDMAEMMGIFPENDPGKTPWNRRSTDNDFNRNKLGLTLELNTPEGADLFKRLVKISDVVLENFSPRVMPNFGLDYPVLKAVNPGIILCSMPGYGLTGPYRNYVSYGTNLEPFSGLSSLMGYPGEGARISGNAYPDPAAALHATGAILTAVFHKLKTGQGQHIDLSQAESATCLIGEAVLGYALDGKIPPRIGNRHPVHAPQGCFRCKGEDKWVAVAVSSEQEWKNLCQAMEHPEWITDIRFSDPVNRRNHQDELDEFIQAWTRQHTHLDAMRLLQATGVPAGAVLDAAELLEDEHLNARGFFQKMDHAECGLRKYCGLPMKFSNPPTFPHRPAPCLGEHNEYVLEKILGLSKEEIARLEEKDVIGAWPMDD
ncbi:MAG: CoA transferase [Desulfobacteraceae bacterium]|nr:CoA transferase [Desulfobacteraceae bacterium]MBU4053147.1 CoA transferase [Pseudomonadota bacterium]